MSPEPISPDQWLIARCQNQANGGNIHDLNNILCAYTGYCSLGMGEKAEHFEKILRAFLVSGKLIRLEEKASENL